MRKLLYILLLSCVLTLSACSQKADTHDAKGNAIHLSALKGKWVVVNYWATWCKPCLTEMPALDKLYQNNKKSLVVIGVSFDTLTNAEIAETAKKYAISYPMTSSFPIKKLGVASVPVLPTTFIINPEGKLVRTLKGPQTEAQFKAAVQ